MRPWIGLALVVVLGCSGKPTPPTPDGGGSSGEGECATPPAYVEELASCAPLATDYRPRVNGSAEDGWPSCISDDNRYHRIQASISSIARVAAFEQIAAKLWEGGKVASPQDFIDARVIYAVDQGLDSRVQRREDIHYPAPASGAKCSDSLAVVEQNPLRCVGPSKLLPVLNEAFAKGIAGEAPRIQARRIEAALLWFMYLSSLSEVLTCTAKPADCDSAWAYYSGGTERDAPAGFARYVQGLGEETHQRAYDATLAVRCWRNLDNETGAATDLALRDRALEQLDVATLRGLALVVRQRYTELACTSGEAQAGRYAFLQLLVPLLDRAARLRDPVKADILRAAIGVEDPAKIDIAAVTSALDGLFGCP